MATAHDGTLTLSDAVAQITGQPLTRGEQLDALATLSETEPEIAAMLDHLAIQSDRTVAFIDALGPALESFADMGEQLMGGGMMGMLGMMMGGGDADASDPFDVEHEAG